MAKPLDKHKMTQRRIAELAGVSQATVSLVLNGRADTTGRIPAKTRDRVLAVIRDTTYVADPAARRLAGVGNKIIGVFTYEPAFPHESEDFYTPLLRGIESEAEVLGCDLLIFTSAPVTDGRRRIFHQNSRLGLADGCLLLGSTMDDEELTRLVDSELPFVAIGRRGAAAGRVPYVGLDYVTATAELVQRALELGHRDFYYAGLPGEAESIIDRQSGFLNGLLTSGARSRLRQVTDDTLSATWQEIEMTRPSVVFVGDAAHAQVLHQLAIDAGLVVPRDLSFVVLNEPSRARDQTVDFARLSPPRARLGSQAVRLLNNILSPDEQPVGFERQILLDCALVPGATLSQPATSGRAL